MDSFEIQLRAAAALADPLRRALYGYLSTVDRDVGRDEAARAVGAPRDRVAAQLDRLAEVGLVDVGFRRLNGRTGPGAGRPSKLYRRSSLRISISLPARRHDVAARVFFGAVVRTGLPSEAVDQAAHAYGAEIGRSAQDTLVSSRTRKTTLTALERIAKHQGFGPVRRGRALVLANCPFASLVENGGGPVCRMNLFLFRGILAGLGVEEVEARAVPRRSGCCVRLEIR